MKFNNNRQFGLLNYFRLLQFGMAQLSLKAPWSFDSPYSTDLYLPQNKFS